MSSTPTKICAHPKCTSKGRPLPLSAYGKNTSSPDGLHWYCRNCHNAKQRQWKKENHGKVIKWSREYHKQKRQGA